jgi:hypothetical protein
VLRRQARQGVNRVRVGALRERGRFRLTITAADAAGNVSPKAVVRFRVR